MRLGTVKSELIKRIGFSGSAGQVGTMRVEYTDQVTYDYFGVEYRVFASIVRAKSPGTKLLEVRDKYKHKRVD